MERARRLPPQHVYQQTDDSNCGPSVIEMVYRFRGIDRNVGQILEDFHFGPKGELTYPPQLARDMQKHGLQTRLMISSPSVISPAWANLDKSELIENIKDWVTLNPDHEKHVLGLHTLFYLQEGGSVELTSYWAADLKERLDRGSLLVVGFDEVWVWGHRFREFSAEIDERRGRTDGHFALITGYNGDKFSVLDPYPTGLPDRDGQYEIDQNQLVNASLLWEGIIVEVMK